MSPTNKAPLANIILAACSARWHFHQGTSINAALQRALANVTPENRPTAQAIIYNGLRSQALIEAIIDELTQRPPELLVRCLLEASLACLLLNSFSEFTVVSQAVNAAKSIEGTKFSAGFVNAILRNFLRKKEEILQRLNKIPSVRFNAPDWWIRKMQKAAPEQWEEILTLQAQRPPMTLRVNIQHHSVEQYQALLEEKGIKSRIVGREALTLETPVNVDELPGFNEGWCSVQDAGTQLAAHWLPVKTGDRVLDACSAPGGKTCHLLERYDCDLTALELDPQRTKKIHENLQRIGLKATVKTANALDLHDWWDKKPFDAILLDAPCSASGVVRRQPDTPWLRRASDIDSLAKTQRQLLNRLWGVLKPQGYLLYATCSLFPEEGKNQIEAFLAQHKDAKLIDLPGLKQGMILLYPEEKSPNLKEGPLPEVHDGFFYALLKKD